MHREVRTIALLALLLPLAACGDDDPFDPLDPNPDVDDPPRAEITSAPATAVVGEEVTVKFTANDDEELFSVSVSFGVTGGPVFIVDSSGRVVTAERSFTYTEPGSYQISVSATDTEGQRAQDTRQIEVTAP